MMNPPKNILSQALTTLSLALVFLSPSYSEPANLGLIKQEIKTYHDSGLYQKELTKKIQEAQRFITQQVLLNKQSKEPQKLALVLDIDETSLSNYSKIMKRDFSGDRKQIHQEILAANSPAIKPMLTLYNDALKKGINIFFVTGRKESERHVTQKNLINAGYSNWSGLYLRPNNYLSRSAIPFKSKTRAAITKQGYTIIASIGDQYSDIKGGYAKKGFKLPNPFYYLP